MIFLQIMKRNIQILLSLSIVAWAVAGCGAPRHLPNKTEVRDSVAITYRDSTIIRYVDVEVPVPAENSYAVVPDSSHLETSVAVSEASVDSLGRLHHSLQNKPVKLTARTEVTDRVLEKIETNKSEEKNTVKVFVEKELTFWQTFRLKAFWWMAGLIAASIAAWIARHIRKL